MQRGSSFNLSSKILVLECVRNLLSSINYPDQGLELENIICNASYSCLCCKNPGSMHPIDLFVDPLTLAKFHQVLVYVCGMFMCLLVKTIPGIHCWTSLLLILKMIWYNVNLFFCLGLRIFPLQIMSLLYQPGLWMVYRFCFTCSAYFISTFLRHLNGYWAWSRIAGQPDRISYWLSIWRSLGRHSCMWS